MIGESAQYYTEQAPVTAYPTGFYKLDMVTNGGLRAGDLSVVGAASGVGKSAFAEELALNVSRNAGVLYLPLEMGDRQTILRMAAKIERRSFDDVQRHGISDSTRVLLNGRQLWTWEPEMRNAFGVNELLRMIADFSGVNVVIIDHVRHIDGWLSASGSHVGASQIVRKLRQFAYETHVHIVLCAQMNRTSYGKRPQMNQLQDTSALEQLASLVVLLHRPFQHKLRDDVTEVLVPKNRYGPCCMIHYRWVGVTMTLWPFTDEEEQLLTCCRPKAS